jgi:hypothetical protein
MLSKANSIQRLKERNVERVRVVRLRHIRKARSVQAKGNILSTSQATCCEFLFRTMDT